MKKIFTLLVALVALTMGVQAQSITSMTAKVSINGGAVQEQSLPATEFPIITLEGATTSFVINDILVETSGTISDVTFFARIYKVNTTGGEHEWAEVPMTHENGLWHIPASTLEQMGGTANGIELIESSMSSDPRYFEFYVVANSSTTPVYWNNGGDNYKIKFSTGEGTEQQVKYYKNGTAGINIIVTGNDGKQTYNEEKDITYTGDFIREKWYGWNPGEISSLVIDDIYVAVSCEDGVGISSVSLQYKVYEDGQTASWNGLEATLFSTSGKKREYKAEGLAKDVTTGLTPGKSYTLEVMYQVVTTESEYIFLAQKTNNDKFTFTYTGSTDVNEISEDAASQGGKTYNLAGQQAGANEKGVLIKKGKKFIKQ